MFVHPQFDPVALSVGPVAVRWYGLMYLLAFAMAWWLGRRALRTQPAPPFNARGFDDLLFACTLGVVLGGRLGYCLFYQPAFYLSHPTQIFAVWEGGMSFHGGLLGVIVAMAWFARRAQLRFWQVSDFIAPLVPLGLAAGRIGNFINGELWGRVTTVPWAVIFPQAADGLPRHPSQLYEALGEGLALFLVMQLYLRVSRPNQAVKPGAVSGLFLLGYGVLRFMLEFTREPDAFLGLLGGGLSMGQWLCLPMMIAGAYLLKQGAPQWKACQPM